MRLILDTYDISKIGASRHRVFLICFSQVRDDPGQWRAYGHDGAGVCLGLRLFNIPSPKDPRIATSFMPVEYDEAELRRKVREWSERYAPLVERAAQGTERQWRAALNAFEMAAAAWALTFKEARWREETEVRMILKVRQGQTVPMETGTRADGSVRRFVPTPVTRLKPMPVEDLIVGPNQDQDTGARRAIELLEALGYGHPERRVRRSTVTVAPEECRMA